VELTFKASPMFDVHGDLSKPEYYTVLCKEKHKRSGWMYCANTNGEVVKVDTESKAKEKCLEIKNNYLEKNFKH
jgi:hypothetical protein